MDAMPAETVHLRAALVADVDRALLFSPDPDLQESYLRGAIGTTFREATR